MTTSNQNRFQQKWHWTFANDGFEEVNGTKNHKTIIDFRLITNMVC